jgi:HEPN domain-containing protein
MKNNNWLEFAQQDLRMAQIAFSEQIYNQACFHCQQAAEKFLKGYLLSKNQNPPKTHFLNELLGLCAQGDKAFDGLEDDCAVLDDYYIPTRYPDALPGALPDGLPDSGDASEALRIVEKIKQFITKKLE